MKPVSFLILACVIAVIGFATLVHAPESSHTITPSRTITLGAISLEVAVVDTDAERAQGLSGIERLEENQGMLFVFETDSRYSFWMKDMRFPIDIFWLAAEGQVVHIEENVSPESYPASFTPDSPARYVLETQAGFAKQYDIRIGSRATLKE